MGLFGSGNAGSLRKACWVSLKQLPFFLGLLGFVGFDGACFFLALFVWSVMVAGSWLPLASGGSLLCVFIAFGVLPAAAARIAVSVLVLWVLL